MKQGTALVLNLAPSPGKLVPAKSRRHLGRFNARVGHHFSSPLTRASKRGGDLALGLSGGRPMGCYVVRRGVRGKRHVHRCGMRAGMGKG